MLPARQLRERERNSPSFDIILSKCVIIDLNKIKTDIQPTHVFPHNLQANTCFFFTKKYWSYRNFKKKKKKSSGRHSSARVFSVYYTAKYIAQKCIVDVWVVVMIETKPTLMTHTVLPKIRFLMTFIQINNTVYIFARIK